MLPIKNLQLLHISYIYLTKDFVEVNDTVIDICSANLIIDVARECRYKTKFSFSGICSVMCSKDTPEFQLVFNRNKEFIWLDFSFLS